MGQRFPSSSFFGTVKLSSCMERRRVRWRLWRAGASPPPGCAPDVASSEAVTPAGGTASSSRQSVLAWTGFFIRRWRYLTRPLLPANSPCLHRGSRADPHRHLFPGHRRRRQFVCRQASSRLLPRMPTVRLLAFAGSTAPWDFVWRTPSCVVEKMTVSGSTPGACNSPARRAGVTLLWPSSPRSGTCAEPLATAVSSFLCSSASAFFFFFFKKKKNSAGQNDYLPFFFSLEVFLPIR